MRLIIVVFLLSSVAFAGETNSVAKDSNKINEAAYYHDRERGWYWYEDPKTIEEEPVQEAKKDTTGGESTSAPTARELLKMQGEDWEQTMAAAILNPSQQNYQEYLTKTALIQAQSQQFADGVKHAIWTNPEYDYTLAHPVETQAIVAKNQQDVAANQKELFSIAQSKGLIFFFRSDCPYCHRFAPILSKFSEAFGFSVIPVSLDGEGLPEYPYPKKNYDLGRKLNVSVVPALFIVNPDSNTVSTVGYGYSDWTTLIQKVLLASKQEN